MRKFSREVVELLSNQPRCRILFSKFIPTFHHHFGHQCRVGDYGFNKLLELFEALQDVIQVENEGDERVVSLTINEQLALLAQRTSQLLQRNHLHIIKLDVFHQMYVKCYTYPICLKEFGVRNVQDLMARFPHVIEIDRCEKSVHLIEKMHLSQLAQQILVILLEAKDGKLPMKDVSKAFRSIWHQQLIPIEYGYSSIVPLMKLLHYVLMVQNEWTDDCYIEMTITHHFARKARCILIRDNRLSMTLEELITKYHALYGKELHPADYGHSTLTSLIGTVPRVLSMMNKGARRAVTVNPSSLVPHWPSDVDETNTLRRLSDCGLSFSKDFPPSYSPLAPEQSTRSQPNPLYSEISCDADSAIHSSNVLPASTSSAELKCEDISSDVLAFKTTLSTEKTSDVADDIAWTISLDDSKTLKRSINKNKVRCHLAANFSVTGS